MFKEVYANISVCTTLVDMVSYDDRVLIAVAT